MPEIYFILYKPAVPGNIGASARALKTMGFTNLRLIQPCDHLGEEAMMMAHASHEILENASVLDTFEQSISDLDFVICTTAKRKSAKHDYHSSREIGKIIAGKKGTAQRIGIIFGPEESGLPNSIIQKADMAVSIPMSGSYPSLNLSQSVMIMAYEMSMLQPDHPRVKKRNSGEEGFSELKQRMITIFERIGIPDGTPLHHRLLERLSLLGEGDISLMHAVSGRVADYIITNDRSREIEKT